MLAWIDVLALNRYLLLLTPSLKNDSIKASLASIVLQIPPRSRCHSYDTNVEQLVQEILVKLAIRPNLKEP